MEESNKGVNAQETAEVIPSSGVGESLTTVPPPTPPVTTFTKVDNNLTGIGFFSASNKRSRKAVEKTTVVVDAGIEHRIAILPSAKFGLPITQDQDYWLGLMKLVSEHLQQGNKPLKNPFSFSTAQLLRILGHQTHNGKNYKAVEEWLGVMVSTTVEGGAYNTIQKTWYNEKTHAVDRVVAVGKKLPDGQLADKNFIWFSQWQLDNINAGNLIAIELYTYTQLQNNIARNLVPHLQEWLFASQHQGRFEKQYEDVCQLLGVRVYRYRSQIQEQFQPSLEELTGHGYISKWAIEAMANNRKAYKLVLWHGRKYHSDRQARLDRNPHRKTERPQLPPVVEAVGQTPTEERAHIRRPRQKSLPLQPEVDAQLIAALTGRGISDTPAVRKLLAELPAAFPTLDTLEWGDLQIAQQQGKIGNAPGFYISLLRDRIQPPATFTPSHLRKQQEEANLRKQQALQDAVRQQQDRDRAAEAAADRQLDELAAQQPAAWQALYNRAKTDVFAQPIMAGKPYGPIHDGAIRARMKHLLMTGEFTANPATRPASTAPGAAGFAAMLHSVMTMPQLPQPHRATAETPFNDDETTTH